MFVGKKDDYVLIVERDSDPLNPRIDWDNLGTMCCWHRRYNLGDENMQSPTEVLEELIEKNVPVDVLETIDMNYMETKEMIELLNKYIVILPLYLYDHSGITISTSPFSCAWDSRMVGFIYADKEAIVQNYNEYTEQTIQLAKEVLEEEVEIYDLYLQGEVYGYKLFLNNEEIDSCWGFIYEWDELLSQIQYSLPSES